MSAATRLMVNVGTGEQHIIELKPRGGMTVAEADAFLADRIAEGKCINPETCDINRRFVEVTDVYSLFEVPEEWSCIGGELFVRNLTDDEWVAIEDLPDDIREAVRARRQKAARARMT